MTTLVAIKNTKTGLFIKENPYKNEKEGLINGVYTSNIEEAFTTDEVSADFIKMAFNEIWDLTSVKI